MPAKLINAHKNTEERGNLKIKLTEAESIKEEKKNSQTSIITEKFQSFLELIYTENLYTEIWSLVSRIFFTATLMDTFFTLTYFIVEYEFFWL